MEEDREDVRGRREVVFKGKECSVTLVTLMNCKFKAYMQCLNF